MDRTIYQQAVDEYGSNCAGAESEEVDVGIWNIGPFAIGGDSGSMVLNVKKELVGIVTQITGFDSANFTPAKDIVADIEEMTGGRITLP